MNGLSTATGQTQSFSEIAFSFRITPEIVMIGLAFAVVMGIVGGLLPALRGARLPLTTALREVTSLDTSAGGTAPGLTSQGDATTMTPLLFLDR